MSWSRWFRSQTKAELNRSSARTKSRKRPLRSALCVEALEDRLVFSVNVVSLAAGTPLSTGNGQSEALPMHSVSNDGHYAVYSSNATNLVPSQSQPPNEVNVFLRDNTTGTTTLISHQNGAPATAANGTSFNAAISGDGSTVAFYSTSTNLIAGLSIPANTVQLYEYLTTSGTYKLISHTPGSPLTGTNGTNPAIPSSPSTHWANTLGYSTPGGALALPSLSTNGQYIAYIDDATNLGATFTGIDPNTFAPDTNAYLYDLSADSNTLISHAAGQPTTSASGPGGAYASTVSISADGSTVVFGDPGTNLISGQNTDGVSDQIYVWSRITNPTTGLSAGQTVLASHAAGSTTTGATVDSTRFFFGFTEDNPPTLSADGTAVAYYHAGSNLVTGQAGRASVLNVFRYNVVTNTNELVTHTAASTTTAGDNPDNQVAPGGFGPAESTGPQISSDGRFIAFANNSSNLVSPSITGQNGRDNVYLYDHSTLQNTLVNHIAGSATTPNANGATAPSMSLDGRYVAFMDLAVPATGSLSGAAGIVNVRLFDRLASTTNQPPIVGQSFDSTPLPPLTGTGSNTPATLSFYASALAPTVLNGDGSVIFWDGPALATSMVPSVTDSNLNLDVFTVIGGMTITAGNNQSIATGSTFGSLQVTVTDPAGNPLSGVTVTFTAPSSGAGGTFAGGTTATATTNSSGVATAPTFTANGTSGPFTVTASGYGSPVTFNESNTTGTATAPTFGSPTATYTFTVNTFGTFTISASGTPTPTYSITTGTAPTGLTFDPTTGVLSGTPTQTGTTTFVVTASNTAGSATQTVTVNVTGTPTVTVSGGPFTFDGSPHAATITATGVGGVPVSGTFAVTYNGSASVPTNAGTYAIVVTFTSSDPNYTNASGSGSITINKATPTATVSGGPFTFDGSPHAAVVTVTGVGGASVSGTFAVTYNGSATVPTNAGTYAVVVTFTSGDANYNNASGSGSLTINKATPTVTVSGGPFTFDGSAHAAIVSATGVGGAAVSGTFVVTYNGSATVPTNAGTYAVVATFTSSDSNYNNASGSGSIAINKATPTVTVSGGPFTFDSSPHAAIVTATGIASAPVSGTFVVTYNGSATVPTNAGTYAVVATFTSSDANYNNASGSGSLTINKATPTVTVSGGPFTFDGGPDAAIVTATGVGGVPVSGTFVVTYNGSATVPTNAGTYTVVATFTSSDSNYNNASGSGSIVINPLTVSPATGSTQTVSLIVNTSASAPFQVSIRDGSNNPISGIGVTYTITSSVGAGGNFTTGSGPAASVQVSTDSNGVATPTFTANTIAGSYAIIATVPGFASPITFNVTNLPDAPANVTVLSGSPQSVTVGSALSTLQVVVKDAFGNVVGAGIPVIFTAPTTGASATFSGATTVQVLTDANSVATSPSATANSQPGSYSIIVTAGTGQAAFSLTNVAVVPTVVYVDPSWANLPAGSTIAGANGTLLVVGSNAFATIQAADNAVAAGGTIIVNGGTYTGGLNLTKAGTVQLAGAVTLDGGGASMLIDAALSAANLTVQGAADVTFTDPVSLTGNLVVTATGTVSLNGGSVDGVIDVTGGNVTLKSGTLRSGSNDSLRATNSLDIVPGTTIEAGGAAVLIGGYQNPNGGSVNIDGTVNAAAAAVLGGPGNDTIEISKTGNIALPVDAGGGVNTLTVDLSGFSTDQKVTVTDGTVSTSALPAPIFYTASGGTFGGGVFVNTGSGNDTVFIMSTAADAPTIVNTGAGNDVINVSSSTDLAVSTLDGLKSRLVVEAGPGSNTLNVSEAGRTEPDTVFITSKSMVGVNGFPNGILYQATGGTFGGGVVFVAGAGDDTLAILSTVSDGQTAVYGRGGNDTFNVAVSSSSNYQNLILDGGDGTNTMGVYDQSGTASVNNAGGAGTVQVSYLDSNSIIKGQNLTKVADNVDPATSFIQSLYHEELGRDALKADLDYWLGVLQTQGSAAVVQGISSSPEALTYTVTLWYKQYLGRAPQGGEEQAQVVRLQTGQTEEVVLADLLASSPEFLNLNDADYITELFSKLIGTKPSADQTTVYVNTLLPQIGRNGAAWLILTSAPYREQVITKDYKDLLGWDLTPADLNALAQSGTSLHQLREQIEESTVFSSVNG